MKREWKRNAIVYIVLIPVIIHFIIFQVYPFLLSFYLTFMDWKVIGDPEFVGLKHWKYLLTDKLAWKAIWNTVMFSVYYIVPTMALGLVLALIINSGLNSRAFSKGFSSYLLLRPLLLLRVFGGGYLGEQKLG